MPPSPTPPVYRSTSATRAHRGSAARTRTPTVSFASTSPRAPTSQDGALAICRTSPMSSTTGPENGSTGALRLKLLTHYSQSDQTHQVLRTPPEPAGAFRAESVG